MSAARKLKAVPIDKAQEALAALAEVLEIGPIESITQRGRDVTNAPYTMRMADGKQTDIRIGTIKVLRSQIALGDVLSVTLKRMPPAIPKDLWHDVIANVINDAVTVTEVGDESYSALVLEWLIRYAERASDNRDKACEDEAPFIKNDKQGLPDIYVHLDAFVKHLGRDREIKATHVEIRGALRDLGFEGPRLINYTKGSGKRSTRFYWTAPMDVLDTSDGLI